MKGARLVVAATALLVAAGAFAGCSGDSGDEPATAAESVATVTSATTTQATPPPATTETEAPLGPGEPARGGQTFVARCGCHANGGRSAGYGPKLAGAGLAEPGIRAIVVNGRTPMPAGLVTGQDLEDVVAYVVSLQ